MPIVFRMAFRNILEHKAKSLIVGILLALGAMILVLGNSFIDASQAGIRSTFTDNYTGDVFISGVSSDGPVSLFGVTSVGGLSPTPVIPDYAKVLSIVEKSPYTSKATGMATGFALVSKDDNSQPQAGSTTTSTTLAQSSPDPAARFLFLFGIDATNYWNVFNSVDITSGSELAPGQTGVILYDKHLEDISKQLGKNLKVGDSILVQGISSSGMRLREIPIVGTYKQKGEGATPSQMAFIDIDSLRVLSGMTVGANENIVLKPAETNMLKVTNADSLFGGGMVDTSASSSGSGAAFSEQKIASQLADTTARNKANQADTGAWQFIVVRTKHPGDASAMIRSLNETFKAQKIAATAGNWQKAAGPYGQSVDVVRIVFTIAIVILAIVAIIIIMNTFVISVIERTGEIGTMRAIGAERSFVRKMFAAETAVLSFVFSTIGAALGTVVVLFLRSLKLQAGNPFFEVLFGGKFLSPFVTPFNFIGAIVAMVAIGYIAHLYPVSVALRIEPVRAMQAE